MSQPVDYKSLRERMVREQIASRHIKDERLLEAMRKIPRHLFVPEKYSRNAYEDRPILIGENQTISQPYIVALMTDLLHLKGDEKVLEIGTGSGYQAAILAALSRHVYTIERHEVLAERAAKILRAMGIENVTVVQGDGSEGLPNHAPYNAIMATAAAPEVPQPLLDQLAVGGRFVLPVGGLGMQYLEAWDRDEEGFRHEALVPVSFVPLRGRHGFKKDWYV